MRFIFPIFLFFFFNNQFFAQEIYLQRNGEDNFYYLYQVQNSDNWYRLAQNSGVKMKKLQFFNGNKSLQPNDTIKIPMYLDFLETDKSTIQNFQEYLEVWYQVAPKDNLFKISRSYFYQPIENLMENNQKSSFELDVNEMLLVGFVKKNLLRLKSLNLNSEKLKKLISSTPSSNSESGEQSQNEALAYFVKYYQHIGEKEASKIKSDSIIGSDSLIDLEKQIQTSDSLERYSTIEEEEILNTQIVRRRGMGVCNVALPNSTKLYVWHARAKVNTKIKITNPLLPRTVEATVLDKIPRNIYPNDVVILISPQVKEILGIRDERFRVELEYIEVIP